MNNNLSPIKVDVLCVGHACYDLVFSVKKHPKSDEKIFADNLISSGGGPAANAAIAISRLGFSSAFAGYLGEDLYGQKHLQEFVDENVDTNLIVRDILSTPLSTVLVKPNGERTLINYKGSTKPLLADAIDFSSVQAQAILLDGHEPKLSLELVELAKKLEIPTILDAGSMHEGTSKLWNKVDYLVASEKFSRQFSDDVHAALNRLSENSPSVVITLGEKGLIWQQGQQTGSLDCFPIKAIDTTGAGDAFHGAFAAALSDGLDWLSILEYSSAAGALCCTHLGARQGLPWKKDHDELMGIKS
ncbi:MAG: PfkB family carbohydrate kinase [Methylococcaceae bacterium]|nr:PfkB family carbohydrate kinase [Methylococcaceae bacterium]